MDIVVFLQRVDLVECLGTYCTLKVRYVLARLMPQGMFQQTSRRRKCKTTSFPRTRHSWQCGVSSFFLLLEFLFFRLCLYLLYGGVFSLFLLFLEFHFLCSSL